MPGPGSVACPKPRPRVYRKREKRLSLAQQERDCRTAVKARDKGRCVVPGCKERAQHLCVAHHQLVHAGKIQISGNADEELIIMGDRKDLEFKL